MDADGSQKITQINTVYKLFKLFFKRLFPFPFSLRSTVKENETVGALAGTHATCTVYVVLFLFPPTASFLSLPVKSWRLVLDDRRVKRKRSVRTANLKERSATHAQILAVPFLRDLQHYCHRLIPQICRPKWGR